jgi:membrane protein YqaA with SNARE-associated domain
MSSYFLGRLGRWEVLERYFGVSKSRVETFKKQIEGWGGFLAFFCWLPLVGDVLAVGLGFFKIKGLKVGFWMLVGKAVRYSIWAALSYWGISLLSFNF